MTPPRARTLSLLVAPWLSIAVAGCSGEVPGNTPTPDAPVAPPVDPIACDPSGNCVGQLGAIKITGLDHDQATRVYNILKALPESLTRAAGFDIGRDPVSQVGCPDLTRTAISSWPANCGYASVATGARLQLNLRDAALITYPSRLDHVLTDFAARDWYLAHADEVLAIEHQSWSVCFACPVDPLEPCWKDDSSQTPLVRVMRNFTSSVATTVLKDQAWDNGARWVNDTACTDAARISALEQRLVQDQPSTVVTKAIDVVGSCPAGSTTIQYQLSTTSGTVPVSLAMIGNQGSLLFYLDNKQATVSPTTQNSNLTGYERLVAFGNQQFELTLISCAP